MAIDDIPYEELRPIYLSPSSKVDEETVRSLELAFELASPSEYRETLLEIYHMYIATEHHALPDDFTKMASHMCILFQFLKDAEK